MGQGDTCHTTSGGAGRRKGRTGDRRRSVSTRTKRARSRQREGIPQRHSPVSHTPATTKTLHAGPTPHAVGQRNRNPVEHHCPRKNDCETLYWRILVARGLFDCLLGAQFGSLSESPRRQHTWPPQMLPLFETALSDKIPLRVTAKRHGRAGNCCAPVTVETEHKSLRSAILVGPAGPTQIATRQSVEQANGMLARDSRA